MINDNHNGSVKTQQRIQYFLDIGFDKKTAIALATFKGSNGIQFATRYD